MYGCTHAAVLARRLHVQLAYVMDWILDVYFDLHLLIRSSVVSRGTRGGLLGWTGLTLHRDRREETVEN